MGQAICRCGQPLEVPPGEVVHVTCPTCAAKVRIVRKSKAGAGSAGNPASSGDGYIRFECPCGRKLKVSLLERPSHGKCPDCGRVVPGPGRWCGAGARGGAHRGHAGRWIRPGSTPGPRSTWRRMPRPVVRPAGSRRDSGSARSAASRSTWGPTPAGPAGWSFPSGPNRIGSGQAEGGGLIVAKRAAAAAQAAAARGLGS